MCHFVRRTCNICRATLRRNPINSGQVLAILGPSELTFECPDVSLSGVKEVEENASCATCRAEEEEEKEAVRRCDHSTVSTFSNNNEELNSTEECQTRHPQYQNRMTLNIHNHLPNSKFNAPKAPSASEHQSPSPAHFAPSHISQALLLRITFQLDLPGGYNPPIFHLRTFSMISSAATSISFLDR